jgi:DNA-binding NtrC family response regulator
MRAPHLEIDRMSKKMPVKPIGNDLAAPSPNVIFSTDGIGDAAQPQIRKSRWSGPEALVSLQKTAEVLAMAYMVTNLNFKTIPLKEFMDDCERKILLSSLRLTHGSQKNAAELLGLKPTALFEKMRKHGINGRKIKLSEKLKAVTPRGLE